jgi:hypothetical protein
MNTRTVDTPYGVLPVVDVWRRCRHTKTGWIGINEKGQRLRIRHRPEERWPSPARMPDEDYAVIGRSAVGDEPRSVNGLVAVGVALIERAARSKPRARGRR